MCLNVRAWLQYGDGYTGGGEASLEISKWAEFLANRIFKFLTLSRLLNSKRYAQLLFPINVQDYFVFTFRPSGFGLCQRETEI
jgi:hypothetical protein